MTDQQFDPQSIFETYRSAFAPVHQAQQEGMKAIERFGRYRYAVAGEYLEWSLALAKALLSAQTPVEFAVKQVELGTALSEKLCARAQEWVTSATDTSNRITEVANEAAAAFVDAAKADAAKMAESAKAAETSKLTEVTKKKAG
jgi:hypothetical protein